MKKISPKESKIITRKIVSPDLLNPNQTLFGGHLMCWIDEVAFMSARRHAGVPTVVTANIDNISFLMPLHVGEHVILTAQVNYVGRSSMEIGVKVEKEDPYTGDKVHANSAYLTFVALDKHGRPKPVAQLELDEEDEHRRWEEAKLRSRVRKRLKNYLQRKLKISTMTSKAESPTEIARKERILKKMREKYHRLLEHIPL